ncbi:hypothetical protein [Rhizobium sp. MHM7A]|uniref:hypothetical protein n=1 Tax=Rhizobium sp. MHM7A TaxID=2583233 RepID=UPI001106C283|nr:hypothetical protein [Rhizobium sp. MHM7A]TLX16323.1 hypothetical protein FFR93_03055 [Rhizobium sp. MHM7A]
MTHVKMNLPFEYKADVVAPGKRTPTTRRFTEWCEVEIEAVSSAEAPIAARWQEYHKIKRVEYARALRHYNDGFYAPADEFSMRGVLTIDNKDDPAWFAEKTHPMISEELLNGIAAAKLYGDPKAHPSDFRHQENNRRDEYFRSFKNNVDRHIFVNGDLWQRVYEPILTVSIFPVGSNDVARVSIQQFQDIDLLAKLENQNAANFFRFSFAEIDALDDFIAVRAADYDPTYFQREDKFSSLEVLLPDAFRIDLCAKDCKSFASLLVEGAHNLHEKDTRAIRCYADLKDACAAEIQNPSPEISDRLITALAGYAEFDGDFHRGIAHALVERHAMRPVSSIGNRI